MLFFLGGGEIALIGFLWWPIKSKPANKLKMTKKTSKDLDGKLKLVKKQLNDMRGMFDALAEKYEKL